MMHKYHKIVPLFFLLLLVGGYLLWGNNTFQYKFFPKNYLSKKVIKLEEEIKDTEWFIKDTKLKLRKLKETYKYDIAQQINIAKYSGDNVQQAKKEEIERIKENIQILKDLINDSREDLKKLREELIKVRSELSKY